ncbi:hypothetical protein TD95_000490 [Thielaviopsis punctulata]|uniref:Partial AB-hydrolase lipase domain-containing protein n=1 Tax=Thielaviopsis punctulata TaxID=72032 RepID=A0A0F4ZA18_9PEZI|nr:hypothetical protein TD95_000490 [Thielaviopsis punctulata]
MASVTVVATKTAPTALTPDAHHHEPTDHELSEPFVISQPASGITHGTSIELVPVHALPASEPLDVPPTAAVARSSPSTATVTAEDKAFAPNFSHLGLGTRIKNRLLQASSYTLSLAFLGTIVSAALLSRIPPTLVAAFYRLTPRNHRDMLRPFYTAEQTLFAQRREAAKAWKAGARSTPEDGFVPTEGGEDLLICDVQYYARRVGLDVETFQVQTDDGFIIELWHVFDPRSYTSLPADRRGPRFSGPLPKIPGHNYPVLLLHGLLQSSGAFCVNDDNSLAFSLAKAGYDVWLGNNRCGFRPRHISLQSKDARMWDWDIREMATFDLPALVARVLAETGHSTLGLACHSQGTAQTLIALSRDFVPELSARLSAVCLLAPAAYAGPLVRRPWFRFMSVLPRSLWRVFFGVHSFVPVMMHAHRWAAPRPYGRLGYVVFSFLFGWTDARWDRGLRNRMFRFAPVHVSAGLMAWWLGRDGFAHAGSILQNASEDSEVPADADHVDKTAWYPPGTPAMGLWICGSDGLVDGQKLLDRLQSEKEPHARVVHAKVIPEYEHLDVLWAMDAPQKVNCEVSRVIWQTCPVRSSCVVPVGCEGEE